MSESASVVSNNFSETEFQTALSDDNIQNTESDVPTIDDAQSTKSDLFSAYADTMHNSSLPTRSQTLRTQPPTDTDAQSTVSGISSAYDSTMPPPLLPTQLRTPQGKRRHRNQLSAETVEAAAHAQRIQDTRQRVETLREEAELLKEEMILKKQLKKLKTQKKKQDNVC
jgi:hypothetical protein